MLRWDLGAGAWEAFWDILNGVSKGSSRGLLEVILSSRSGQMGLSWSPFLTKECPDARGDLQFCWQEPLGSAKMALDRRLQVR